MDGISLAPYTIVRGAPSRTHWPLTSQLRNEILRAGQDEDVGFVVIEYCGRPLSVLRVIAGQSKRPAEAEGAVAGAGIVGEGKLGPKPERPGWCKRERQRPGAGDRIGGEFLSHAADRAAAFRQANGLRGKAAAGSSIVGSLLLALHALAPFFPPLVSGFNQDENHPSTLITA